MNFENKINIVESSKEENLNRAENELSLDEKQYFINSWKSEIIDGYFDIEGVEQINNQELRQNLNESLIKDVKQLSDEWGIKINKDLSEEEYIEEIRIQMNGLAKKAKGDTRWDSWPKKMRKDEGFNCVGATLLGINALKEKGIESCYGNPWGHVVNMAKLSSGKWMYLDLRNNIVKEIDPEEIVLAGNRILKINDEDIDYKLIPIYNNSFAVGSIVGNLSILETEKGNEEGRDIYQNIKQKLFPEFKEIENLQEMKIEKERIESMQEVERKVKEYFEKLSKEKREEILQESFNKKELIKQSIINDSLMGDFSNELKDLLELLIDGFNAITKEEIKKEAVDRFLIKVDKLDL